MTYVEILEILVCVLAVYGFYALICHLLAFLCPKGELSMGVHVDGEGEIAPLEDMHYAIILTEEHRGHLQPPVFLLDKTVDKQTEGVLREQGYRLYRKIEDE